MQNHPIMFDFFSLPSSYLSTTHGQAFRCSLSITAMLSRIEQSFRWLGKAEHCIVAITDTVSSHPGLYDGYKLAVVLFIATHDLV
jgi:hypothetical protein